MLNKSFGIVYFLRRLRHLDLENQCIYLRITIDEQRVELSAKRSCSPKNWSSRTGRVIGGKQEAKILNTYLDTLKLKIYDKYSELLQEGQKITPKLLKDRLTGAVENKRMILEIFEHHNEQVRELVGNTYAPLTYKRYRTALRHTREFIQWKYKLADLEIIKLDYEFICEFEFFLKSVRKCGHNSAMKYLANFKKIVLLCVKKGWLVRDPFFGFKLAKKEVVKDYLTQDELDSITQKSFCSERLTITRDIFLFSCYTGLAYVDVHKLKRSEIVVGIDGKKWILTRRQKTEIQSRIPLLPVCLQILERYEEHPECVIKDKVLPVRSNQKLNEYLKEIAALSGVTKRLTYHVARHTFATTVTLNNGVPIETVSKMLGHKTLRTTQHYAKLLDKKVSEDMEALQKKLDVNGTIVPAKRI